MNAQIWRADGSEQFFEFTGARPTLSEMQTVVGGYIEVVALSGGRVLMIVNEEGLLQKLPLNNGATIRAGKPIVGDVIVMPKGLMR